MNITCTLHTCNWSSIHSHKVKHIRYSLLVIYWLLVMHLSQISLNEIIRFTRNLLDVPEIRVYEVDIISFDPVYRFIFLICSIAAITTSGYFYCGCLLYTVIRNQVFRVVLLAIRRSGKINGLWVHHWEDFVKHIEFAIIWNLLNFDMFVHL